MWQDLEEGCGLGAIRRFRPTGAGTCPRFHLLVGPRLCFSFLPWSGLAPGLGKAEPAGEGHRKVGQSSRDGDRKPDFSRPRVTWKVKTRDF